MNLNQLKMILSIKINKRKEISQVKAHKINLKINHLKNITNFYKLNALKLE